MSALPDAAIDLDLPTALARLADGALLLDVREPGEWALGSPPEALRIALGALDAALAEGRVPPGAVVALCATGRRSRDAARRLRAAGRAEAWSLDGGFAAWKAAGLPQAPVSQLDAEDRERYARHLLLPQVGEAGQLRLARATVLLVGAGGLGSPVALYLAAAGVGTLRIVDPDRVERSNLQRQVLHADDRVGESKVVSARRTLNALNPRVRIDAVAARLDAGNVRALLDGVDVVVDGSDNFAARYVLDTACTAAGLPWVYGAIHRFEGQVAVFGGAPGAPCYRCLFPDPPAAQDAPNCAEAGVLGVLPGLVGSLQATEALKLLLGIGTPLRGRLLLVDALGAAFRTLGVPRDPQCPGCGPPALRRAPAGLEALCDLR